MNYIKIDDVDLHYIKKGKGQSVLFLHGILLDTSIYDKLINTLSKKYCVYAIDLPYHGKTKNENKYYSISNMEKIVKKFCEKLKIKNPIIYGHSAGSAISIIFTSENKVKELNLIQPAGLKYYNSIYSILFRIYLLHLFLVLLITLLTFIKYFFVQ